MNSLKVRSGNGFAIGTATHAPLLLMLLIAIGIASSLPHLSAAQSNPLSFTVTPSSPQTAVTSQSVSYNIQVTGSTGTYTLTVSGPGGTPIYKTDAGIKTQLYTEMFSESNPGTYTIVFTVQDSDSHIATVQTSLTVTGAPSSNGAGPSSPAALSATVTAPSGTITAGSQASFTVTASGGTPPYFLTVRNSAVDGGSILTADQQITSPYTFSTTTTGYSASTHTLLFTVSDSHQQSISPATPPSFTVTAAPVTPSIMLSPSSGPTGTTFTVTATGFPPSSPLSPAFISFGNVGVSGAGGIDIATSGSYTGTYVVPPAASGTITVTIAEGTAGASATFTVGSSGSNSNPNPNSNSNSNSQVPTGQAGICVSSSGSAGCVSATTSCNNALNPPGVTCAAVQASATQDCAPPNNYVCEEVSSTGGGTLGGPTGGTGPTGAQLTAIQQEIGNICNAIESIVFILGLALMLLGGALYAGSHVMPGQTRGQIQGYGMSMLIGGLVGVIIALVAPWVLNEVIILSNTGSVSVSCSSAGASLPSLGSGTPTVPTTPTTPTTPSSPAGGTGTQTLTATPTLTNPGTPGQLITYTLTVADTNPAPYTITVTDDQDSSFHDSVQASGGSFTYDFTLPSSAQGGVNRITFTLSDSLGGTASATATVLVTTSS